MSASTTTGTSVDRDSEGFLLHSEQWSEELAEVTARDNGIDELTPLHWQVINAMRTAYVEHGTMPWVHMTARVSKVPIKELYELFPKGPSRLVTKIAGIPRNRACISALGASGTPMYRPSQRWGTRAAVRARGEMLVACPATARTSLMTSPRPRSHQVRRRPAIDRALPGAARRFLRSRLPSTKSPRRTRHRPLA